MSRLSKQLLPRQAINFLRHFRHFIYLVLLPVDYVNRAINGKADFPPVHLRRYVGPLRSFEASGAEFTAYLRLLAELQPKDSILDVGCGCGLMAIFLKDYLDEEGRYTGVDIHRPSISWCARNIGERHPNFRFEHIDVKNQAFNPKGTHSAEDYSFPFEAHAFEVILLKSVFTHMRPAEVENYLQEVSRLLKRGGRCLVSFFLLNDEQARLATKERQRLQFNFGDGVWRYVYEQRAESAVAYEESYILDLLRKCGLVLQGKIYYGTWTGRSDGLSFQDILLLKKG
ncbi:MAG TPA: class I SAM-dependent methyltransferase [Pyrinomonadaceae bacterium]